MIRKDKRRKKSRKPLYATILLRVYFFFLVHFTRSSLNIEREYWINVFFFFYGASCHTLNWYYSILLFTLDNWDWGGGCWLMNTRTVYLNFGCLIAIIKQIWASLNDNVITDFLSEKLYQNQFFLMKWLCIRTMVLTSIYSATPFIKFWLLLFLLNVNMMDMLIWCCSIERIWISLTII